MNSLMDDGDKGGSMEERLRIVAWLRQEADLGWREANESHTHTQPPPVRSRVLWDVADSIEKGEHHRRAG